MFFRRFKKAVNKGIGLVRQSAVLDLEAAFEALDDRTCAPVCDRGDVGLRNLSGRFAFGGGLGSLLGGLDAPRFENRCQGFGQGATLGVRVLW